MAPALLDDDNARPAKRKLLDDSDSDAAGIDGGGVELKVNKQYAQRFEHNKKREEMQQLEEKYKKDGGSQGDDSDENDNEDEDKDSEDETEDDDGFLVTAELDAQISATLQAIRNKDPRVYDKSATFYTADETAQGKDGPAKKAKPFYLRDYHRERLLRGDAGASDDEHDDRDARHAAQPPRTEWEEQAALKKSFISEVDAAMGGAGSDDENEGGHFIKRKRGSAKAGPEPEPEPVDEAGLPAARAKPIVKTGKANRKLTEIDLANADRQPELYLSNFMAARAWVPVEGSRWKAFESDDDDDAASNLDRVDEIETAYNLRFEDPSKSNEVLTTYSRNVADAKSVRRDRLTGRQRQRELERERREAERAQRRDEKARLRRLKVEEAEGRLRKIRQAAGASGKSLGDDEWLGFLDDEWDNDRWEDEMRKRFDETYYAADEEGDVSSDDDNGRDEKDEKLRKGESKGKGGKGKSKNKKPKWDDDIDIKDLIPDFDDGDARPDITLSDLEEDDAKGGDEPEEPEEPDESDESDESVEGGRPSKRRKTAKDRRNDRLAAKKTARQTRSKIEALVDAHLGIDAHDLVAAGPSLPSSTAAAAAAVASATVPTSSYSKPSLPFRYRETSPQTFGLTERDILLAPSDAALNEFAGLKKLASFRPEDKKRHDRKRLSKKARLRQWRRDVFGVEYERTGPTYGFGGEGEWGEEGGGVKASMVVGKSAAAVNNGLGDRDGGKSEGGGADVGGENTAKKKRKRKKKKKSGKERQLPVEG